MKLPVQIEFVACGECNGAGEINLGPERFCGCDHCDGTGKVPSDYVEIDLDALAQALYTRSLLGASR